MPDARAFPAITAHRGGGGEAAENALSTFRRATGLAVESVEFDVHLAADGVPVVIHDVTVDRTCNGHGAVTSLASDHLARLRLNGGLDEGVPTLDDVLGVLATSRLNPVLEIKAPSPDSPYEGLERLCLEALERHGLLERTTIISFCWPALRMIRSLSPEIAIGGAAGWPLGAPRGAIQAECARLAEIGGNSIIINRDHYDPDGIALARGLGLKIGRAPIVTREQMEFWFSQDIDMLSSDFPSLAAEVRASLQALG